MNRSGENGDLPNRNTRFFESGGYWYYNTREGVAIGPFDTLSEAETGVSDFIDFMIHAEPCVSETLAKYSGTEAAA